jgi:NAD(P)H-flavin reductase
MHTCTLLPPSTLHAHAHSLTSRHTPSLSPQVSLVFGNISEEDILLREKLDAMASKNPDQLKLFYILDKPPAKGWSGGSGYITQVGGRCGMHRARI